MKMKCLDCGHVFDGDNSVYECPKCQSTNITEVGTGSSWKKIIVAVATLGIIGGVVAAIIGHKDLSARLRPLENGDVGVEVKGTSNSDLNKNYKVLVYDESGNLHTSMGFSKKREMAICSKSNLLEGSCYSFKLVEKSNKTIKSLKWNGSNKYCVPISPLPPVKPVIANVSNGVADHNKLVWNKVTIKMETPGNYSYQIGDRRQDTPVFDNIKPGTYNVVVSNEKNLKAEQQLFLPEIQKLQPPMSVADVQNVFNQVTKGSLSISAALKILAVGNVDLVSVVQPGDISTLYGALMEASMGEHISVVSFSTDPNTNKIKSGTLKLRR